jgi:NitT/TauT family transport system ATP-binding protein
VGPSGCGKSTLLHVAAGLIRPTTGTVTYLGKEWPGLHPDIGYLTQKDTLLPWRNVVDNIALPLELKGVRKAERRAKAGEIAERLGLGPHLHAFPNHLSGGMRQRVQLGRTLIGEPRLLLMDEPFGALDAYLRLKMQQLLRDVIDVNHPTILFVTHDLPEAISLADEVVALTGSPGQIGRVDVIDDLPDRNDLMSLREQSSFIAHEQQLWRIISGAVAPESDTAQNGARENRENVAARQA